MYIHTHIICIIYLSLSLYIYIYLSIMYMCNMILNMIKARNSESKDRFDFHLAEDLFLGKPFLL